jgi:hypothetical protein
MQCIHHNHPIEKKPQGMASAHCGCKPAAVHLYRGPVLTF